MSDHKQKLAMRIGTINANKSIRVSRDKKDKSP